jgi:hypothetical protein
VWVSRDPAKRWHLQVLPLRCHILHERLPHDVVYPLGARQLRLQPRDLILEFRRASIQSRRCKRGITVLVVPRSIMMSRSRSRLDEEFPIAEKLLARIRRDGIARRGLS